MAKFAIAKGSTSVILTVFIQDASSTSGAGLGSLNSASSIVGGYVRRNGTGVALAVDEAVSVPGTYQAPTTAAQVRIGTVANMRTGTYELHFHNDLFAAGADWVTITLGGATNMADLPIEVQLTDLDLNTATVDVGAINGSAAAAIRLALSAGIAIIPGTVDTATNAHTPTTTEFQADDITEATADHFAQSGNERGVIFTSGALLGQYAKITGYELVGGIGQFTVQAMTEAPANNDTFLII